MFSLWANSLDRQTRGIGQKGRKTKRGQNHEKKTTFTDKNRAIDGYG